MSTLDFNNWHQWEPVANTEINQFKEAESAINHGIKFIFTQLSRPLTIEYMEDYTELWLKVAKPTDLGMRTEIGQPFINSRSIIKAMQLFQYEQQAPWTFIISHVSKEVLHHIQLDVTFFDIDRNKDTYDLWALKEEYSNKRHNNYNYNLQNLRNK
jgi:hypothetical protein